MVKKKDFTIYKKILYLYSVTRNDVALKIIKIKNKMKYLFKYCKTIIIIISRAKRVYSQGIHIALAREQGSQYTVRRALTHVLFGTMTSYDLMKPTLPFHLQCCRLGTTCEASTPPWQLYFANCMSACYVHVLGVVGCTAQ